MIVVIAVCIIVPIGGFLFYAWASGDGRKSDTETLGKYTQAGWVSKNGCLQKRPPR